MAKRCRHRPAESFKVDGLWRCCACGKVEAWGDGWQAYGPLSCPKCHAEPAIEFVACSDECSRRLDPDHPEITRSIERATVARVLASLDGKILQAQQRVSELRGERDRVARAMEGCDEAELS